MRHAESRVLVTGAGSGIGRAIALRLLDEGAAVIATDIRHDPLLEMAAGASAAARGRLLTQELDVTNEDDWGSAVRAAEDRFGTVTGLVNNAGITRDATMLKMPVEAFDAVIDTHLRASWLGCRSVIPGMRAAGGGAIVNVSSSGRHGVIGQTNYSAAKAGIVGLTKAVALEQARHGIRCNAVAPGAIETPMTAAVPERIKEEWCSTIALGRLGKPEEIAAVASFLLSEEASYITAHILDVDGGEPHQ